MCALLVGSLAGLVGCSTKLIVESSTSWSGFITTRYTGRSVAGAGDQVFKLQSDDSDFCWSFQKLTEGGVLRAYIKDGWSGITGSHHRFAETTAPFGYVTGCQ